MPRSSAKSKARLVGADFDRIMATPILAAFRRTSEEILPLNAMILSFNGIRWIRQ
jgi:hypothetical protein